MKTWPQTTHHYPKRRSTCRDVKKYPAMWSEPLPLPKWELWAPASSLGPDLKTWVCRCHLCEGKGAQSGQAFHKSGDLYKVHSAVSLGSSSQQPTHPIPPLAQKRWQEFQMSASCLVPRVAVSNQRKQPYKHRGHFPSMSPGLVPPASPHIYPKTPHPHPTLWQRAAKSSSYPALCRRQREKRWEQASLNPRKNMPCPPIAIRKPLPEGAICPMEKTRSCSRKSETQSKRNISDLRLTSKPLGPSLWLTATHSKYNWGFLTCWWCKCPREG